MSVQSEATGPVALDSLSKPQRKLLERSARDALRDVGAGTRRWQHGDAPHVLHVRRRLSDDEVGALPPGPPPIDSAGGGRLYRVCSVRP